MNIWLGIHGWRAGYDSKDEHMVRYTRVACRLLDVETCRCSNYWRRKELVPNCVTLDTNNLKEFNWLPKSCAYRRLYENRGLADWHPLVSGNKDSVHEAGISVSGIALIKNCVTLLYQVGSDVHWVALIKAVFKTAR